MILLVVSNYLSIFGCETMFIMMSTFFKHIDVRKSLPAKEGRIGCFTPPGFKIH